MLLFFLNKTTHTHIHTNKPVVKSVTQLSAAPFVQPHTREIVSKFRSNFINCHFYNYKDMLEKEQEKFLPNA